MSPTAELKVRRGQLCWGRGVQPRVCIKGQGSVRLVCKHTSALFSFSQRDSLGSTEVIGLEGSISNAGVPENNCDSHTLCLVAKQHKPEGTPVAAWCPVSSCSPHLSAKATYEAEATYRQVS